MARSVVSDVALVLIIVLKLTLKFVVLLPYFVLKLYLYLFKLSHFLFRFWGERNVFALSYANVKQYFKQTQARVHALMKNLTLNQDLTSHIP